MAKKVKYDFAVKTGGIYRGGTLTAGYGCIGILANTGINVFFDDYVILKKITAACLGTDAGSVNQVMAMRVDLPNEIFNVLPFTQDAPGTPTVYSLGSSGSSINFILYGPSFSGTTVSFLISPGYHKFILTNLPLNGFVPVSAINNLIFEYEMTQ